MGEAHRSVFIEFILKFVELFRAEEDLPVRG